MSLETTEPRLPFGVVLGDANVIYSRVLRDYLLYAMTHQLIRVRWSRNILDEVIEHLIGNIDGFDEAAGQRLVHGDERRVPFLAGRADRGGHGRRGSLLVYEGDRHVIAAAVAAEATFVCSEDRTGFPLDVLATLGIEAITADSLLSALIEEAPDTMLEVHRVVVSRLRGATHESTVAALRAARAERTADLIEELLATRAAIVDGDGSGVVG